jgi:hypothetical protein
MEGAGGGPSATRADRRTARVRAARDAGREHIQQLTTAASALAIPARAGPASVTPPRGGAFEPARVTGCR